MIVRGQGKYGVGIPERRTFEGIVFHSIRECDAYRGFRMLEKSGQIKKLERQVKFRLLAARLVLGIWTAVEVSSYIADFVVTELDGTKRIYESKGVRTPEYKLKFKLFHANYPDLRIVEM